MIFLLSSTAYEDGLEEQGQTPSREHNYSMRVVEHGLQHGKFQLDPRKNIFIIVKQWNGLPREVVALPPHKSQSGKVSSNPVKLILL